jgi:hypothetical protein
MSISRNRPLFDSTRPPRGYATNPQSPRVDVTYFQYGNRHICMLIHQCRARAAAFLSTTLGRRAGRLGDGRPAAHPPLPDLHRLRSTDYRARRLQTISVRRWHVRVRWCVCDSARWFVVCCVLCARSYQNLYCRSIQRQKEHASGPCSDRTRRPSAHGLPPAPWEMAETAARGPRRDPSPPRPRTLRLDATYRPHMSRKCEHVSCRVVSCGVLCVCVVSLIAHVPLDRLFRWVPFCRA